MVAAELSLSDQLIVDCDVLTPGLLEALTVSQAVVDALLNDSDLEIPVTASLAPALCGILAG